MINLLEETLETIKENGLCTNDIVFIGSEETGHRCTWDEFLKLANIDYDNGYGGAEIATDLIIVFKDGSIVSRGEYDGSEWWELRRPFKMPVENKKITKILVDNMYGTLAEIND